MSSIRHAHAPVEQEATWPATPCGRPRAVAIRARAASVSSPLAESQGYLTDDDVFRDVS